jgi:very-short-patch-repair endonuclease
LFGEASVDDRGVRVGKAVTGWKNALIDLGGRNNLVHFRDLKVGTLDLTMANPDVVSNLLLGKTVRVSALFRDTGVSEQILRRVRALHNKSKENSEERGLDTLSIGCGLATWENKRATWVPCAPVLLQRAELAPMGAAHDEFELRLTGEMRVSPILMHVLGVDFGCEFDLEELERRIPDGSIDEPWELEETFQWIAGQAAGVPGFRVERRTVLANFAYAKLAMVSDLNSSLAELTEHDLIAALAGDAGAREAIRAQGPSPDSVPGPDQVPLASEFLVLDADSSQNYAINAVLGGRNLIIKGPPGTGKSQTIANLVASLIARGKKVLFVAEKRAAIDAVTKRLDHQNLGDLVLDLHDGVTSRRSFAQTIGQVLATSRNAPPVVNGGDLDLTGKRRDQLNAYVRMLHGERDPWKVSVYELRARRSGMVPPGIDARFRGAAIEALDGKTARKVAEDLAQYARLGGLTLATDGNPWARSPISTADEVRYANEVLDEVRRAFPSVRTLLEQAASETGLPSPRNPSGWTGLLDVWSQVDQCLSVVTPQIYDLDLEAACAALAPAGHGGIARLFAILTSGRYRTTRGEVRAGLRKSGANDAAVLSATISARDSLRQWAEHGGTGLPRTPQALGECRTSRGRLLSLLSHVEEMAGLPGLAMGSFDDVEATLDKLSGDRGTLARLPELYRLHSSLQSAGLGEFVEGLQGRRASEEFAVNAFWYVWVCSVLDHVSMTDLSVESFTVAAQNGAVREFVDGDRRHIETTPARVRRAYAENVVRVLDAYKGQADLVRHQTGLKRRHMPVREFVARTADVLLALKPCWAMSPLVVSQLLPTRPYFDVVIFDEASQITPADAATSILRGQQLVVAGDDKQLPPTTFFESSTDDEEEDEDGPGELPAGTSGFESILDALSAILTFRMLLWHYRSRDERLIAFSNAHIYDRALTTFPGTGGDHVLRYVRVPWQPGAETNSPAPEVEAVVDLILEHASGRPAESLGVITMGITHRNRIEEHLRERLRLNPELAEQLSEFFDESRPERFFVKNLERVQGDERDAIILSIGYGKNSNGILPYRFGPLLPEGGERRLNVAVTRAKARLTLVSSFTANDMDPERSRAQGVKLLRQYLQYVESDGTNLGDQIVDKPLLNPFEIDVRDTLAQRGLKLTPQYGTSGYWIDFAAQHPDRPGDYVLAIECDGATYHSSQSARDRDRLRQEQLELKGWRFHRIWSTEWFRDKNACADKAVAAYEAALRPRTSKAANRLPTSYEAAQSRTAQSTVVVAPLQGPRPPVIPRLPIGGYSDSELLSLAHWIRSDEVLRTEDELLQEMMRQLGFQKRGKNVVARLTAAIKQSAP